ncbi:MAG: hypothetical protein Fur0014_03520 [Rubrivivax sp.]
MLSAARLHPVRLRRREAGMSLVELMVGIAVGLFIVGAATMVVTTQLGDNRRLLIETQLQQDLRASVDIITRELRRSGAWGAASQGIWYPESPSPAASNPFQALDVDGEAGSVTFEYHRGPGAEGPYGFRLRSGVIQTQLAGSGWQDLTDANVMTVTRFAIESVENRSDPLPCPRLCPDGTTGCWPRLVSRTLRIDIEAEARGDDSVQRTLSTVVRPRNDEVEFNNGGSVCP